MKSLAVMEDKSLKVVEVSRPQVENSSMIVKVLACGVCNGTDMKIVHGNFKNIDVYPTLLGHEAVGEVVEVGKDVKNYRVGDIVLNPYIEGGIDEYSSAWGSYSEYGVCRDWEAMAKNGIGPGTPGFPECVYTQKKLPKDFDPVSSTMIVTLREVLAAAKKFGFKSNESIAIFGAGPVGSAFIRFAKLLGMGPIISFDVIDEKVKEAELMGADYAFNSTKVDVVSKVREICPDGVDYSLDAVGINAIIQTGMELIKDSGKLLTYGISPKLNMELDWSKAPYNWSLQFCQMPTKTEEAAAHEQIINWIQLGVLDPKSFISHVFDFDHILDAFKMLEDRVPCKKMVIKYF